MVAIEIVEDEEKKEVQDEKWKEKEREQGRSGTTSRTDNPREEKVSNNKLGEKPDGESISSIDAVDEPSNKPGKLSSKDLRGARAEAAQKKGQTNGSSNEAEGEGWETASEGDESNAAHDGDGINGKAAATSSTNERFEDAMTEEEQHMRALAQATSAKADGHKLYAVGSYNEALQSYASALESAPDHPSSNEIRAQCYSNCAICQIQLNNYAEAVKESTKALELDPNYMKALMRRAQAQEKLENFEDAIKDLRKVTELDPENRQARESIQQLEPLAAEKTEKMKAEMIGKLKEMGNSVLGRFGMSIDNFKAVQDPNTGSYSISFQK